MKGKDNFAQEVIRLRTVIDKHFLPTSDSDITISNKKIIEELKRLLMRTQAEMFKYQFNPQDYKEYAQSILYIAQAIGTISNQ